MREDVRRVILAALSVATIPWDATLAERMQQLVRELDQFAWDELLQLAPQEPQQTKVILAAVAAVVATRDEQQLAEALEELDQALQAIPMHELAGSLIARSVSTEEYAKCPRCGRVAGHPPFPDCQEY